MPPAQKIVNPTAMFSGLDKITGRITAFDASIGETVQFGALRVTARACYSRPPTETPLTDGFVEVDEVTLQGEVRRIFTGWMFAASPGLHAVEHPIYDVWLTGCKGGAAVADAQPAPAAAVAPARPSASQRQAAPRTTQQNAPNGQRGPSLRDPAGPRHRPLNAFCGAQPLRFRTRVVKARSILIESLLGIEFRVAKCLIESERFRLRQARGCREIPTVRSGWPDPDE